MDISVTSNTITIHGDIKSVADYQAIKSAVDSIKDTHSAITLKIVDSIFITSSIIGYLNRLRLKDKIEITIEVATPQLIELFEDLNLTELFTIQRVNDA